MDEKEVHERIKKESIEYLRRFNIHTDDPFQSKYRGVLRAFLRDQYEYTKLVCDKILSSLALAEIVEEVEAGK